jgi:hypothetical protein
MDNQTKHEIWILDAAALVPFRCYRHRSDRCHQVAVWKDKERCVIS